MARNIETREGYEFWDRLCRLQRYSFFLGAGPSVRKVEDGTGSWIEFYGAQSVMDDAQSEINELREQNAALEAEVQALREELTALRARVVVVPGRIPSNGPKEEWYLTGWNACLDELARLNGKAVSEGLLRRTLEFIKATNYQGSIPLGLIAELSELLGEGKEVGDVLVRE